MSLFYFFGGDGTDRAGLGGGCMPRRCTPAPSSAPGLAAQHRQQGRPHTGTHARTLDTLHRVDQDGGMAGWLARRVRNCADLDRLQQLKKVNEKIYFFAKKP